MSKIIALLRTPDPKISECELTHLQRDPINFNLLLKQHQAYAQALSDLGIHIEYVPELKGSADGVFVEDTALVLDEIAVICRPGADSRKHEIETVFEAVKPFRKLVKYITFPATLDGGDLLQIERTIYVGLSSRSNQAAAEQLKALLSPFDYVVKTIPVSRSLHLKTAASYLGQGRLLINPDWIDETHFSGLKIIHVHPSEPFAANALQINNFIIHTSENPLTGQKLKDFGFEVKSTAISELAKAEAGLTCLGLIFRSTP